MIYRLLGQYEKTIDTKNRVQLPSQLRSVVDPKRDGCTVYVTLGEFKCTLAVYTEATFDELAGRLETEFDADPTARRFELQFYSLVSPAEMDKQGRFVIPDRLRQKARLQDDIYLIGQRNRIEIWNRKDLDAKREIEWESEDWPEWHQFIRRRPRFKRPGIRLVADDDEVRESDVPQSGKEESGASPDTRGEDAE